MIFVTVGTHEQQFNRLIAEVDRMKAEGVITEDVIIQTGFSTYEPKACKWSKLFPYQEVLKLVSEARIVVTHGGPSSFIMPLQVGKIPVVVPRQEAYAEHVNDHQVAFSRVVAQRQGNILVVEDVAKLQNVLVNYDELVSAMTAEMKSNNARFCAELEKIVEGLI